MKIIKLLTICLLGYLSMACTTLTGQPDPNDPFESYNRSMYDFNNSLDKYVIKPVAQVYNDYVPAPISKSISNVFSNLDDVIVLINDLLQLKFTQAASDAARIFFNTTVGLFGLFDVASHLDLPKHEEDFGQTLGYWGMPSGAYVVLPFFGPRTVRDTFGLGVDLATDPSLQVEHVRTSNTLLGVQTLDYRASLLFASDLLQEAALDEYAYVRDAYLQRRLYYIYDGDPPDEDEDEEDEGKWE